MMPTLTVVDAGARYGLHPTWAPLRHVANFHLFEVDPEEAGRLQRKYQSDPGITTHNLGLYRTEGVLQFTMTQHRALTSAFDPNRDLLQKENYKQDEFRATGTFECRTVTVDNFFTGQPVHFLKLDVEGAELDVLNGAKDTLRNSVLGVRAEVCFAPIIKNAPLFSDINTFLTEFGFELLNLDYDGRGAPAGRFTRNGKFGKLLSTDAVWTVPTDRIFSAAYGDVAATVLRQAIFFMLNSATDVAIELLMRAEREGVDITAYKDTPLYRELRRQVLLLMKDLLYYPQMVEKDIYDTYERIFKEEYPSMNRLYESDLI